MVLLKLLSLKPQAHLLEVSVYAAAAWRLAYMLTNETGPFMLFTKLRTATGIKHDEFGYPIAFPVGNVLSCLYCTSVWMALLLLVSPRWLVNLFAISGIATIADKALEKHLPMMELQDG